MTPQIQPQTTSTTIATMKMRAALSAASPLGMSKRRPAPMTTVIKHSLEFGERHVKDSDGPWSCEEGPRRLWGWQVGGGEDFWCILQMLFAFGFGVFV